MDSVTNKNTNGGNSLHHSNLNFIVIRIDIFTFISSAAITEEIIEDDATTYKPF